MDVHIRRSGEDYARGMASLLPRGVAWPRDPESLIYKVIRGLAQIWGSPGVDQASDVPGTTQIVDARAGDLLERESDPRMTVELLPDWERAWGLPDPCFTTPQTIADRQKMLVLKMTWLGAQSRRYFIDVMAMIGYHISIREFAPFMAGISRCGDTRAEDVFAGGDGSHYRWQIGPQDLRFYWSIRVGMAQLTWFRASRGQSGVDPHLRIGIATDAQCLLDRWKPAHTEIVLDYSGLAHGGSMQGTP
jgi:uncharacterized protein YmfQ (DUF2313 family)